MFYLATYTLKNDVDYEHFWLSLQKYTNSEGFLHCFFGKIHLPQTSFDITCQKASF